MNNGPSAAITAQGVFSATEPPLRLRMLPLALLIVLVIGGLTPWLYQESKRLSSNREAHYMAITMSEGLNRLSARFPLLWSYKPQEVRAVIEPFEELGASVSCINAQGRLIYRTEERRPLQSPITEVSSQVRDASGQSLALITVRLISPPTTERLLPWLVGGIVALFVGWLLLTVPLRSARFADHQNHELLEELLHLNHVLEQRVSERTSALEQINQRLLTIQEEERGRISRNLHDELGQTLTGLRLQLTTLALTSSSDQQQVVIQRSIEIVDLGIDQVRRIAYEQRPPELDMLGLIEAVRAISSRVSQKGHLEISVESPTLPPLADLLNIALFRACQEGITNAIRHGQCSKIEVKFEIESGLLLLSISDDGLGLVDTLEWGGGLSGIHGRLKSYHGKLIVTVSALGGLSLMMRVPLNKISKET